MSHYCWFDVKRWVLQAAVAGLLLNLLLPAELPQFAAAVHAQDVVDSSETDVERRRILKLIESVETLRDDQTLLAAETFDLAWSLSVQGEDPVLNLNTDLGDMLRPGQHEVNAGARSRLQSLYENSSPGFRKAYEEFAANNAQIALRNDIERGNTSDLIQTVLRFQFTQPGQRALENIVQLRLSRGELLQAALQYGRLMRLNNDDSTKSFVQLSSLWWKAGLPEEAVDLLATAAQKDPEGKLELAGRPLILPSTDGDLFGWLSKHFGTAAETASAGLWQQPLGNYRRTERQSVGPALLDQSWSVSGYRCEECIDCPDGDEINRLLQPLQSRMDEYFRQMLAANETVSPVAQPILVNDLLIFRGVAKIRAVNRHSGELVWETALIDRSLNAALESWRRLGMEDPSALGQVYRLLAPRLFVNSVRDNVGGQLTTNGKLVFAVEAATSEPLSADVDFRGIPSQKPVNYLRAYDVETGQLKGQAGGPVGVSAGGPVNPLAGMFFLGAPLVMGDRIYVISENDQGIILLQLKATPLLDDDGQVDMRPVRSQLLSIPRNSLATHPVRRYAGVIPSYSGGLLICNTVDEQVIAISAEDHSLRWMYRYPGNVSIPELERGFAVLGNAYNAQQSAAVDLASRWTDALPRIVANRVYITPRDSDRLICLDLQTGKELWTRARGNMRNLAVVQPERLVLTGQRSIECLDAVTGEPIWNVDLEDGRISGRAVSDGTILQVPTSVPAIISYDLNSGRKLLTQRLPDVTPGNLLSVDGELYSQTLTQVAQFKVAEANEKLPITSVHEHLLAGRLQAAEDVIASIQSSADSQSDQRRQANELLIDMLLESLHFDFEGNVQRIAELQKLIENSAAPDDQIVELVDAMLGITLSDAAILPELWLQANNNRKRLAQLQALITKSHLADTSRSPQQIGMEIVELLESASTAEASHVQRADVAVSGFRSTVASVREALLSADASQRQQIRDTVHPHLVRHVAEAKSAAEASWWWQASLLSGFTQSAAAMAVDESLQLAEPFAQALRHVSLVDAVDQSDSVSGNSEVGSQAQALMDQFLKNDRLLSARQLLERSLQRATMSQNDRIAEIKPVANVAREFALPPEAMSIANLQKRLLDERLNAAELLPPFSGTPEVIESDAHIGTSPARLRNDSPHQTIPIFGGQGGFANWALVQRPNSGVIYAYDADGRLRWSFQHWDTQAYSYRGLSPMFNGLNEHYAVAYGELLAIKLDHMLFMLDCSSATAVQEPEKLWELNVSTAVDSATDAQGTIPAWQRTSQYDIQPGGLYPVGPLSAFGVPVYSGRRLAVFNLFTGVREWEADGLPGDCTMSVSGDEIQMISKGAGQVESRQLVDGKVSRVTPLPLWWNDAEENSNASVRTFELIASEDERWRLLIDDGRCVLVRRNATEAALECYNLKSGGLDWSLPLPPDSAVSNVADAHVAILSNGNELQIVDTKAGNRVCKLAVPEAADNMYLYLRPSAGQWLVLTDAFDQDHDEQNPVNESVQVSGQIYSVNQASGELSWSFAITNEWLRIATPSQSPVLSNFPVLTLLKRPYPAPGPNGIRGGAAYRLKVLDVRTGKLLYEDNNMGLGLNYFCIKPDDEKRELDLGIDIRSIKFRYGSSEDTSN
ncbi:MAG: PQQ-binding-like beta-propeller repeat protein [Fuerstiella sp.]